jgi:hypothetical protein
MSLDSVETKSQCNCAPNYTVKYERWKGRILNAVVRNLDNKAQKIQEFTTPTSYNFSS